MNEVRNLNDKRVADISMDKRVIEICIQGYTTRITANPNGTLNVIHGIANPAA